LGRAVKSYLVAIPMVIVVSEEDGTISLVRTGTITRELFPRSLSW
jgi:DNA integrity scanning protein DisA with diadenylate cyclase activity